VNRLPRREQRHGQFYCARRNPKVGVQRVRRAVLVHHGHPTLGTEDFAALGLAKGCGGTTNAMNTAHVSFSAVHGCH
jgi:hypothetical protein